MSPMTAKVVPGETESVLAVLYASRRIARPLSLR